MKLPKKNIGETAIINGKDAVVYIAGENVEKYYKAKYYIVSVDYGEYDNEWIYHYISKGCVIVFKDKDIIK